VDHFHPGQLDEFEHPLVGAQTAEAIHFTHALLLYFLRGVALLFLSFKQPFGHYLHNCKIFAYNYSG
jgi:hypothetical protein